MGGAFEGGPQGGQQAPLARRAVGELDAGAEGKIILPMMKNYIEKYPPSGEFE